MKKKVLLLSASAGAGHVRAADAILGVLKDRPDVSEAVHWDMLTYTNRLFRHLYSQLYLDLVNRAPEMLGWIYDFYDTPWRNDKLRVAFEKLNSGRFIRGVKSFAPDVVICTHFTPAAILSWLFEHGKLSLLPSIVVTDFDCHAMWLVRHYAHYFVALDETKHYLERVGVQSDKVTVSGIPISQECSKVKDQAAVREALGLDSTRFTILVSAGGFGVGPIEVLIQELLRIPQPVQIVAIAGRSAELKADLDTLATRHGSGGSTVLHPVGFTTRMDDYMAAADILVGKAGGLTSSEALARGLPLCIVNPIPGQEERNSDHLLEAGAAIRCNNLPVLGWKLSRLIEAPHRLATMRERARTLGKPSAAATIVTRLMGTAHSETTP